MTKIFKDYIEFTNREDKEVNGVSESFAADNPEWEKQAVTQPSALDMGAWHTCDTTHCRAGWVVHLAGAEGYELEKRTSTQFAALQIYHKSSSIAVPPTRFFDDNITAMNDIKRCAETEKQTA